MVLADHASLLDDERPGLEERLGRTVSERPDPTEQIEKLWGDGGRTQSAFSDKPGIHWPDARLAGDGLHEVGSERIDVAGRDREAGRATVAAEADQVVRAGGHGLDRADPGRRPYRGPADAV